MHPPDPRQSSRLWQPMPNTLPLRPFRVDAGATRPTTPGIGISDQATEAWASYCGDRIVASVLFASHGASSRLPSCRITMS